MSTTKRSVKKQKASTDAAAKEAKNNNTNNATIDEQPEQAQPEQAEQPDILCTLNVPCVVCDDNNTEDDTTELRIGDTIRLKADTTNGTAFIEINPTDDSRNPDKPNGWRVDTREAYKNLQKAMKGLRVSYSYTDDRRTRVEGQAVIVGCGMDSTNDRATLKLSTGSVIASGYCFKVLGFDSNYAHTDRTTDTADTDNRPAALIRADIADIDKRIERLQAKREALQKALTKALETDLAAVRSTLELYPTDRATLELVTATPTADRIPTDRLEALKAVEGIPAAAAAVRALIVEAYSEEALQLSTTDPAQVANADKVAAIMAERGLKLGDIPTEILP